jgi:IS5 family transposase
MTTGLRSWLDERPVAGQADKGITLRSGTLVDATIIDAPSSTKNRTGARDPEMSSAKKGNDWSFGMKAHIGVDADSGVTHSLETSTAGLHDSQVWDELLHGGETSVWAGRGYVSAAREAAFQGPGKVRGVMRKAPKGGRIPLDERANRIIAMVRARVEHPFRVIKRQFGHVRTRYRGLAKNRAQLFTLFAPGNLFLVRRKLMA